MQGDHQNDTWNNGQQQQQNDPNAYYFQQNGTSNRLSCGASKLSALFRQL
jgi:hypothetical protein